MWKKQRRYQCIFLISILGLFFNSCTANIVVTPMIINFVKGGPVYQDIKVTNRSNKKQYIAVNAYSVVNPGLKTAKEVPIKNPKQAGLLVTPVKMVLLPRRSKVVRLSLLTPVGEQERIYRLQVEPRRPLLQEVENEKGVAVGAQVAILIAYTVKVRVAPLHPKPTFSLVRKGKTLTFKNKGNITIILNKVKQCKVNEKCKYLISRAIYPGETRRYTLPEAKPVSYEIYTATEKAKAYRSN